MNKISTLIAASALAILPLTGAHADSDNPRYEGFAVQDTAPAQRYFTSNKAGATQRIVPTDGRLQQPHINKDTDRFNYAGDGSIQTN